MKIWCDVCDKEEASVFCSADEAALCGGCDRRVHHANKLAGKHSRFSLQHPTFKESPLCDICQERRAFLFCREDRAILCRECDFSIHKANEHTQKHNRFLLTGVKLSASSSLYDTTTETGTQTSESSSMGRPSGSVSNEIYSSSPTEKILPPASCKIEDNYTSDTASISTSSISEYLLETLPGWQFEDFLEPSSTTNAFCKIHDQDCESDQMNSFSSEDLATWAPRSSQLPFCLPYKGLVHGFEESKEANSLENGWRWRGDSFEVPHLSPPCLKKCRRFQ